MAQEQKIFRRQRSTRFGVCWLYWVIDRRILEAQFTMTMNNDISLTTQSVNQSTIDNILRLNVQ